MDPGSARQRPLTTAPSFTQWNSRSVLSLAVSKEPPNPELVSTLIRNETFQIDVYDENSVSPLQIAVRKGNADLMSAPLETGHKPLDCHDYCHYGVLAAACCNGMASTVKQILAWGLPANRTNHKNLELRAFDSNSVARNSAALYIFQNLDMGHYAALHIAVRFFPSLTAALIAYRALVSNTATYVIKTANGSSTRVEEVTLLHLALGSSAELLIAHGEANVFAKDGHGRTPLFWAATEITPGLSNENLLAVETNLSHGSPVNIRDNSGHTPLAALALNMSSQLVRSGWREDASLGTDQDTMEECAYIALEIVKRGAKIDIPLGNDSHVSIKSMFIDIAKDSFVRRILKPDSWQLVEYLGID